jgi:hypothetical protein
MSVAYLLTPPVPKTKSIQSWDWSIMNYGGFGRKSELAVLEVQSVPSHLRALGWINCNVIFVKAWTGPGGSGRLRLPDFSTIGI